MRTEVNFRLQTKGKMQTTDFLKVYIVLFPLELANGPLKTQGLVKCGSRFLFFSDYSVRPAFPIFILSCLGVSIFCKAKDLVVPILLFVFINGVFSSEKSRP